MKKLIALALLSTSLTSFAQISPLDGLKTNSIDKNTSIAIWNSMKTDTNRHSECFNRAMAWMYDINKEFGVVGKKYIIHYTAKYNKEISSKWGFHIAPMIKVDGIDMVFDRGFPMWIDGPRTKDQWEDVFLVHGVEKLIELRKELKEKISEKQEKIKKTRYEIKSLSRSDDFYLEYRNQLEEKINGLQEKINEYESELNYLEISDQDVQKWVETRNNEITKEQEDLKQLLKTAHKNSILEIKQRIRELDKFLTKIKRDKDQAIDIRCKKITHIEELDYNQFNNYCYMQEVSMYYWGIPQLRLLNYGPGYGIGSLPEESSLADAREKGAEYIQTSFNMDQVWDARAEAFSDYKKQWEEEYKELKDTEREEKEQQRMLERRERERERNQERMERFNRQRERELARQEEQQRRMQERRERMNR